MEMEMKKININILDESEIEQRVIALIRTKPKGISDKALSNEMPDLKPHRRGEIINKLVSQGHVELLKQAGLLVYRFKDSTKLVKGSTNEEKIVFKIIEEVGNKGIWIGDIRKKTNLIHGQLRTILKNFEDERLIKVKTSVTSNKKMHMLYHLEPDVSITGSVWYQDNEIETEFIDVLSQQCYQFLEQKRENMESLNSGPSGPIAARNAMSASSEEIWKFISDLGISKVKLSIKEIEMILKTLIYDGKIEQIPSGDDKNLYKSIRPLVNLSGLIGNPCGLCPVRKKCSDEDGQHAEAEDYLSSSKHEWTWDEKFSTSSIKLSDNNLNVTFHPVYSTGTAVVRGNKPLEKGRHHFWEILMLTHIYGTDVMVGVGTANAELHDAGDDFCALLGRDRESWGFSYKGYLQHDGKTCKYGRTFGQNIGEHLVGIHLDAWTGTLQFFINREPLGVAFTKLNNVTLYPLVSSTMAQCVMKLTWSCSTPVSLQTTCLTVLSPSQKAYLSKRCPGLRHLTQNIFADILQKSIDCNSEEDIEFPEYIILDDLDYALVLGIKKKKRY